MPTETLQTKLAAMQASLRSLARVAVAYSGGVDSVFVLRVAVDTLGPDNVLAVTADNSSLPRRELRRAVELAESMKVRHLLVDPLEFENPDYLSNPTDRCYFCKSALYDRMAQVIGDYGITAIVNGSNADDLGDYRPGHAAATERMIHSPCIEAGLTKADIRALSAQIGLPTAEKPAAPCLASRVPYGEAITPEKLRMIEQGENFLHDLGIPECRVRHHGTLARIEVPPDAIERLTTPEWRARLDAAFRKFGYQYVALDLRGFRTGSLNEVIPLGRLDS